MTTIEFKNHSMKKYSFKQGLKENKEDVIYMLKEKKMFFKIFLGFFLTGICLQLVNLNDFGFIFSFFLFPAIMASVLQNQKYETPIKKLIFSKIFNLKTYAIFLTLFVFIFLSVFIPIEIIAANMKMTASDLLQSVVSYLSVLQAPDPVSAQTSLDAFFSTDLGARFQSGLNNINYTVFYSSYILGAFLFIVSIIICFIAIMQNFCLRDIGYWQNFKISVSFNIKNSGYFFGKTLGVVGVSILLAMITENISFSLFTITLLTALNALVGVYIIYVFYSMINNSIEEKEIK